jgi:uncharacterized repeat protein (TIGR01451 family)
MFVLSGAAGSQTLFLAPNTALAPGASLIVHITGTATALDPSLPNTATVSATNEAPVLQGQSSSATVSVTAPDVTVKKTADQGTVVAGGVAGFTVTITNTGGGAATGVTLTDPLPALGGSNLWAIDPASPNATTFVITGPAGSQVLSLAPNTTLAAGGTLVVHITGTTTPSGSPFAATLPNTATVSAVNEAPPLQNQHSQTTVTVLSPDVTVVKTADSSTISAGLPDGFTVVITNHGQGTAAGVTLTDPLPALGGTNLWTIDSASPNAGAFVLSGPAGSQVLSLAPNTSLAAGASLTVHITGIVTPLVTSLPNTATVNATNEAGGLQSQSSSATVTVATLSLGDLVFLDRNNDGRQDGTEPGVPGVTVALLDAAGNTIATTVTDASGHYQFTGLPVGTYRVRITPPAGYISSTGTIGAATGPHEPAAGVPFTDPTNGADHGTADATGGTITSGPVTLTSAGSNPDSVLNSLSGTANENVDFGVFQPISLGDFVWNDTNNDGMLDNGETGIPEVVVDLLDGSGHALLTAGGAPITTTTDATGHYLFTDLVPGAYQIRLDAANFVASRPLAGFTSSSGTNGSPTGPYEPATGNPFANPTNSTDHGTMNATGGTVTSGIITLTAAGTNPDATAGAPAGTANLNADVGVYEPLSIGNFVWADLRNNGVYDPSEPRLAGVTVTLLDASGAVVGTTTTDANGNYNFTDLIPGTYTVQVTPPPGYTPSPTTGSGANQNHGTASGPFTVSTVTLGPPGSSTNPNGGGLSNQLQNFGLVNLAAVSGFVYTDPNVNGQFEPQLGEKGIGGVTVTLTGTDVSGNSVTKTTTTDATGAYAFTGLVPGNYTITESAPYGFYLHTLDTPGSLGGGNPTSRVLTVTLGGNQDGQNYNFGETAPASVFGTVYADQNQNGVLDPGETGLGGVPVAISGTAFAGTTLARPLTAADVAGGLTAITDATGGYSFPTLPEGSYTIQVVTQPAGYFPGALQVGDPSQPTPTAANGQFSVVLGATTFRGPLNFAELIPTMDVTKREFLGSTPAVDPAVAGTVMAPVAAGSTSPAFTVTTGHPNTPAFVVTAPGAGQSPLIRVFDYATGAEKFRFNAYESSFTGGVRVAIGDVNGDGIPDIVTATGVGGGPRIRVFSGKDGSLLMDFFAYEPTFRGGVYVAVGDINGDGKADIITGVETGGGPRIEVFSGADESVIANFFAFDPTQRGGVRVAADDFNRDGKADIVATTGPGVPTRVRVFDGATQAVLTDYAPYESGFTGGVNIATGDVNGDGTPDIVVGAETGGGPRVRVFSGLTNTPIADFFAYEPTMTAGVRVAMADVNGDGKADLVVAPGPGAPSRVRVLEAPGLQEVDNFYAYPTSFLGGVYLG